MTTKPAFISVKTLRAKFHESMLNHGAIHAGAYYRLETGHVEPDSERKYWLRISLDATGYGHDLCTLQIDRWPAMDAPKESLEWFQENLRPYLQRAIDYMGKDRPAQLPGLGHSAPVTILRDNLIEVVDKWIPQELAWQTDTSRIGQERLNHEHI